MITNFINFLLGSCGIALAFVVGSVLFGRRPAVLWQRALTCYLIAAALSLVIATFPWILSKGLVLFLLLTLPPIGLVIMIGITEEQKKEIKLKLVSKRTILILTIFILAWALFFSSSFSSAEFLTPFIMLIISLTFVFTILHPRYALGHNCNGWVFSSLLFVWFSGVWLSEHPENYSMSVGPSLNVFSMITLCIFGLTFAGYILREIISLICKLFRRPLSINRSARWLSTTTFFVLFGAVSVGLIESARLVEFLKQASEVRGVFLGTSLLTFLLSGALIVFHFRAQALPRFVEFFLIAWAFGFLSFHTTYELLSLPSETSTSSLPFLFAYAGGVLAYSLAGLIYLIGRLPMAFYSDAEFLAGTEFPDDNLGLEFQNYRLSALDVFVLSTQVLIIWYIDFAISMSFTFLLIATIAVLWLKLEAYFLENKSRYLKYLPVFDS